MVEKKDENGHLHSSHRKLLIRVPSHSGQLFEWAELSALPVDVYEAQVSATIILATCCFVIQKANDAAEDAGERECHDESDTTLL